MKFFCEYCGARIDPEVDDYCPGCHASYKNNKKFKEIEKMKEEDKEYEDNIRRQALETVSGGLKTFGRVRSASFAITFIIVFAFIITVSVVIFNVNKDINSEIKDSLTDKVDDLIDGLKDEKNVIGNINEFAQGKNYKFKVTDYKTVEFWYKEPKEGYEFVEFNFMVENISKNKISREKVNCIVDGVAQENDFSSGYSTLPFFIEKDLTVTGSATFMVPINAKSYDIRYGDYITIHIEK